MERSKISTWELIDDIGIITINNPPQNFLVDPDFVELEDLKKWTSIEGLKGLIIKGQGRHFSAGADKRRLFRQLEEEQIQNNINNGKDVLDYISNVAIPTIAAIKGVCLGGGLEVALACHVRICSDRSIFSFPETSLGIMPGLNGTVRLPLQLGLAKSIEAVLTGRIIDADEALKINLVDYVVPAKEVFDFSLDFMKSITQDRSVPVINAVIQSFNNSRNLSDDEAIDEGIRLFSELAASVS